MRKTRFILPLSVFTITISLFCTNTSCNSDAPKATVVFVDSSDRVTESTEINDEPNEYTVHLSPYDGTAETALKQINQISYAVENKKITGYSYLYNDNSGEGELHGLLCFSNDGTKDKDWYLSLNNDNYQMEYFFGKNDELFAIRQWKYTDKGKEQTAEILYNEIEGVIKGSWLKRTNEDTTDLASYTGDFWYDFLEGWPIYHNTKAMVG